MKVPEAVGFLEERESPCNEDWQRIRDLGAHGRTGNNETPRSLPTVCELPKRYSKLQARSSLFGRPSYRSHHQFSSFHFGIRWKGNKHDATVR